MFKFPIKLYWKKKATTSGRLNFVYGSSLPTIDLKVLFTSPPTFHVCSCGNYILNDRAGEYRSDNHTILFPHFVYCTFFVTLTFDYTFQYFFSIGRAYVLSVLYRRVQKI